jgi:hypothetical protein
LVFGKESLLLNTIIFIGVFLYKKLGFFIKKLGFLQGETIRVRKIIGRPYPLLIPHQN